MTIARSHKEEVRHELKILTVHLDGGPRCAARVRLAADLAERFGGRIVGIAPTGVPDVIVTKKGADGAKLVELTAASLREKAAKTAQAFDAQCQALGVSFESRVVVEEAVTRWSSTAGAAI